MSFKVGLITSAVVIAAAATGCDPAPQAPEYKNHGAEVSSVARNTDASGQDKGAEVADVARDGHGQR